MVLTLNRMRLVLSVFSLALAILDEVDLDPPTWGKL